MCKLNSSPFLYKVMGSKEQNARGTVTFILLVQLCRHSCRDKYATEHHYHAFVRQLSISAMLLHDNAITEFYIVRRWTHTHGHMHIRFSLGFSDAFVLERIVSNFLYKRTYLYPSYSIDTEHLRRN